MDNLQKPGRFVPDFDQREPQIYTTDMTLEKIGTDASMDENIASGYGIIEFDREELMPDGKLKPDVEVRFMRHYPDYLSEYIAGELMTATYIDANAAMEIYYEHKKDIDSFTGMTDRGFPDNEYELLQLLDDIESYCGLP